MGRQELLDAARNGDKRTVEKILAQITKRSGPFTSLRRGAGVNAQDDNGYTALHHACLHGHKEIVKLLLSVDASPCIEDKKRATPLHLAAWKGDSNVVAMLLAHNNPPVDIDHLTSDRETALLIAAHFGYVDVVAQLMAKGADVTIRNVNRESALDLAAQYGRVKTVQHLLCVMPQLVDPYKLPKSRGKTFSSTPLHRASRNGCKDVVLSLLEAGIDPNIKTSNGTALHEAACFGRTSVVRVLLENGADPNVKDMRDKTVKDMLADYQSDATRKVWKIITEFENKSRMTSESEEDLPPFPVTDYSPSYPPVGIVKAPETQENTNKNNSFVSLSTSYQLTKNPSQSFVQKLASKCLGLKAKFSSAPNISNNATNEPEVDVKPKHSDHKNSTNTLLIGNSKFFKRLSKKESSGDIVCNDEFDTISLDRISTINRDAVVNRSNRSCPGFKNSLPNISENNELSDESISESIVIIEIDSDSNNANTKPREAVNLNVNSINIKKSKRLSGTSNESASYINECYEAYEFSDKENSSQINTPIPPPRPNAHVRNINNEDIIYENINNIHVPNKHPTPAIRTNLPLKNPINEASETVLYENVSLISKRNQSMLPKLTEIPFSTKSEERGTPSHSRSSTLSSDSMIDESNLEDILLSKKSKSFKHNKNISGIYKESIMSELSSASSESLEYESDSSDVTEASALENVDCSGDSKNGICLSMCGTLPQKRTESLDKKKALFRHKTFTNIEIDRNSARGSDLQNRNNEFLRETLAHYHIRGTGHCIYNAPTVSEFIDIFNRDTLHRDAPHFTKLAKNKRDSYYETAICFCKPKPPKHHNSAEDLLEVYTQDEIEKVSIDYDALKRHNEVQATSFRCFCDSGQCVFHADKKTMENFTVKFSVVKKSISTPNITLNISPSLTIKNRSMYHNRLDSVELKEQCAVVNIGVNKPELYNDLSKNTNDNDCCVSKVSSTPSTLSSDRPYSLKDIEDAISLNSTSTATGQNRAFNFNPIPLRQSSSEHSGHWSLQSCESNATVNSDVSFATCIEESSEQDSDDTSHSDEDISDAETVKSDVSTNKKPWVHSDSFKFNSRDVKCISKIIQEEGTADSSSKFESGINVEYTESSSSECGDDSGVPRVEADVSLVASLERGSGVVAGVRSGSGRRRWEEAEATSEGDALSVSSAASSCAPQHLAHHQKYSKVSPTPPKKPPRRNLSVSPTHANSPSSGYSYELRPHARSQDDLDDIQGAKHYLKHGRSVDQYVDGKLSYSEYEDNHNSPRLAPVPNPRPSLKHRSQPVAITATYENVIIKEQNPRRKLRRNNFAPQYENFEPRMNDGRVRKYSNQEKSSLESLLDNQSINSPSDCERYYDGPRIEIPSSPSHYEQPPTPDHPPPSARHAENSIHERIRPLSQLIMEVVEEIRIEKRAKEKI